MLNECTNCKGRFHGDSPSNLARAIELLETADCVFNFLWKNRVTPLRNFSFEFFWAIFTKYAPLPFSIPWCKKVKKWPQKLKSTGGGGACTWVRELSETDGKSNPTPT